MRREPSVLHLDLDAFFAAVEQRDKPSLRGRPVVVGGLGPRGVVATASYEARVYGVRSAMPTAHARRLCPHAAYLAGRFAAYRATSQVVMEILRRWSPLVEPLSLDEAFVDLAAGRDDAAGRLDVAAAREHAAAIRAEIFARTRLTASVGVATSKLLAKIASELDKPDGLVVVAPGDELAVLHPLPVERLWGVGPATAQRLRRLGVATIGDLAAVPVDELVGALGQAHGTGLHRLARAADDRPVVSERESKSVSVEETFPVDVADRSRLRAELDLMTERVARRLAASGYSGRTVTLKARLHDFRTLSRSTTLPGATDDAGVLRRVARGLLAEVDVTSGLRLLGVGVSGLSDQAQAELPDLLPDARAAAADDAAPVEDASDAQPASARRWLPGADVRHETLGPGWVQGSGVGRVTVRFETAATGPGPVRTFAIDDPALAPAEPQPVRVLTESAPEST